MKDKIDSFSKGNFEYALPLINLSEEKIELTIEAGKAYDGSFTIANSAGRRMKGYVHSTNSLMSLQEDSFHDVTYTIHYHFNAEALKAGDKISGEFYISSDCGEAVLPFYIQIEAPYCMSALGKIKDLFQFTNLAKADWSDAKRVFKSEDFEHIFLANEERFKVIYQDLSKSISTSQALEEFLIAIRKKPSIRLEVDKTQVEYNVSKESFTDSVALTKNHWGYEEIRVSTDVPFIQLEQKFLWADQFTSNTQQITYVINPKLMGYGNNFGHIVIKSPHQTITIGILCKNKRPERKLSLSNLRRKTESAFMDAYLSFRLNRISLTDYIEVTEALLAKLPGPEVSYVRELIKIHLAIISGKSELAGELLSDFAKEEAVIRKRSILEYCAYRYLDALYRKEDTTVNQAAEAIHNYYTNGNFDWRVLWFLLYTDKRYETNKGAKLVDIKEQFDAGCRSPILYYEAICVYNEEPYLLRELGDFEIQTINFGIKNWLLSKDVAKQYTYLSGKRKSFHPLVFQGLTHLYDEFDTTEILSAICSILIKGMKKSEKYFEWYQRGVEAQLRITELYEYYMYSISNSMQDRIAMPVLLYFIYNNNLNDHKKAFLYAAVIQNKDIDEAIYRSYYKKIEVFVLKMLAGGFINRDLALLYREFLKKPPLSEEVLQYLPEVLYRNKLICNNPNMVSVTVIHKELERESITPLTDGRAQIDLFTNNAVIILMDSFGNRYQESVEYSITPYMNAEEYENSCIAYSNNSKLLLHLFDRYQSLRILSEDSIELRKRVLLIEGLSSECTTDCLHTLIDYYYENFNDELFEYYLNQIDLTIVKQNERTKYIELMLIRTFYQKAIAAMETYGYNGVPVNRLVKLCSGWMKTSGAQKRNHFMVNLSYYVFSQGKYDEAILRYLINYYQGSTREMFKLWQAARGFEMECHLLEERLLTQLLFTECYIEDSFLVFYTYYKEVTNHLLVRAFLTYYAYQYLVHNRVVDAKLFQLMKRELFYEENDICLLAWLKHNAQEASLSENELIFAEYNIQRMVKRGIILPFFLLYKNLIALPDQILDKFYISYHADPGKRIFIHYWLANSKNQEYSTERMPDTFMGIHTKEFILFYHEELQYYITEESEEETNITESFDIHYDGESLEEDDSNYNHINSMLMALEMKDNATLLELMEDYAMKEYMIEACFKPID